MFPSRLTRLQAQLKERLYRARSETAREEWKRRLAAVEEQLLGGKVEDAPKQPKPVVPSPTLTPKEPTLEELVNGAHMLISLGKSDLMTPAQREAIQQASR